MPKTVVVDATIVLVCARPHRAAATIAAIQASAPSTELVVVQAGPPDPVLDDLAGRFENVQLALHPDALGPVLGAAAGGALARTEWIAWLDDTAEPMPGWLSILLGAGDERPRAGILAPCIEDHAGHVLSSGWTALSDGTLMAHPAEVRSACEIDAPGGVCVLTRTAAWRAAGGLDAAYDDLGAAFAALAFAARRTGWETWLAPAARVRTERLPTMRDHDRVRFARRFAVELAAHEPPPGRAVRTPDRRARPVGARARAASDETAGTVVILGPGDDGPFGPSARREAVVEAFGPGVAVVGLDELDAVPEHAAWVWIEAAAAPSALGAARSSAPGARVVLDVRHRPEPLSPPSAEELWLWGRADVIVAASPDLAAVVGRAGVDATLIHDPWEIGPPRNRPDSDTVVLAADFREPWSMDAAGLAVREILPRVALVRPDVRMTLVGPAVAAVRALASRNVTVAPSDRMPAVVARAAVALAVARGGDGPDVGATAALSAGVPVVATGEVASRVGRGDGLIVGRDAVALAAAVAELLRDDAHWYNQAVAGQARAARTWGREAVVAGLRALAAR